jgi:TetR/AcrR family transcriptional repressor of nem operon
MRYPPEHKERTRQKIVHAASRSFRGAGADVAIGDLMRELKLTHGGFYRHFRDKEELFNEAFAASVEHATARLVAVAQAAPQGREAEAIVNFYLSGGHCANAAEGCPIAALATEMGRHPQSSRQGFDRLLRSVGAAFARWMPGESERERRQTAMVLFASMAGALNVARAVADESLRRTILGQARSFCLRALDRA